MLGHAQDGVQRIRLVQRTLAPSAPLIICPSLRGVSASPSSIGAGEYITRMSLARAICEGVEAAAPDGWEPDEGEDGGFEEVPDGV